MDRETWSALPIFAAIVEAGSFSRAAARLGVSPSALSHAMRGLETRVGVRLLHRTTRSLAPSEAGAELLKQLRPAMDGLSDALGALEQARERPAGTVRVNAHRSAALHAIVPRLPDLARAAPDVAVELSVDDGLVDIVAGRFDCGVRHEGELQLDMVSMRISDPVPLVFVAAPAYLAERPPPATPDGLNRHRCLCYRYTTAGTVHVWEFVHGGVVSTAAVPAALVTNDVDVMRDAALAGLGIACLPRPHAEAHLRAGTLREVLAGFGPVLPPSHLYYPSRRQPSAAFRAFLDAMRMR